MGRWWECPSGSVTKSTEKCQEKAISKDHTYPGPHQNGGLYTIKLEGLTPHSFIKLKIKTISF